MPDSPSLIPRKPQGGFAEAADPGEFSVWQDFSDGSREHVLHRVSARRAVTTAKALAESVGGLIGTTERVVITDGDDFIAFEWKYGGGVVFPTQAECEAAKREDRG